MALSVIDGGVLAARGFLAAGVRCGIKRKRRDIGLLVFADRQPHAAAGVMTTNFVVGPSVARNRQVLAHGGGLVEGIVINSGNANVGNGPQGDADNAAMADLAAACGTGGAYLTASTGVIGHYLPMEIVENGIRAASVALTGDPATSEQFAEAILTTDTFKKEIAVEFALEDGTIARIGGAAKGSGMIEPNMATMLAFLTTDVAIAPVALHAALKTAVDDSFNCLTVDSDTSTSDQCLILASGSAGNPELTEASPAFVDALTFVCTHLAREIARDGEGATKLVTVRVLGGPDTAGAKKVAKSIANSPLVKTALFGNDPNWGRLLAAAGKAGVPFDPKDASASLAGVEVYRHGVPAPFDAAALSEKMKAKELEIVVDLGVGDGEAAVYTCDFSYDYVKINAEYHT